LLRARKPAESAITELAAVGDCVVVGVFLGKPGGPTSLPTSFKGLMEVVSVLSDRFVTVAFARRGFCKEAITDIQQALSQAKAVGLLIPA